jgi:hypothetical protein
MILTVENLDDLLDLYQRAYGRDLFAGMPLQLKIEILFEKNVNFGMYHNNKLVSAVRLRSSRIDGIQSISGWTMDKYFHDMNFKLQSLDESHKYAAAHGYVLIHIAPTRLGSILNKALLVSRAIPVVTKRIKVFPAGSYSGIKWIDEFYFFNGPPQVEWSASLIRYSSQS